MIVDRTTMLLSRYPAKPALETLLIEIASPRRVDIQYTDASNQGYDDQTAICVRMASLMGAAKCELEINWNGNCKLGDDAVGFRVGELLQCNVILRNYDESPTKWLLLTADFEIENLIVDEKLLQTQRYVSYNIL